MALTLRTVITVLAHWIFISAALLTPLMVGYFTNAPSIFGILAWFEIIVLGFPWNIAVGLLCDSGFEQKYFPGLFVSLNQNHDYTVGYFMFIGYVSVSINSFFIALILHLGRKQKNHSNTKSNA